MNLNKKLLKYVISKTSTILDAAKQINTNLKGMVIIIDEQNKIIGTVTDGDIRRAVIRGDDLNQPITFLLDKKINLYEKPITAKAGTDVDTLLKIMETNVIKHIPLIDSEDHFVDLIGIEDLLPQVKKEYIGVIMAGGFGHRLGALTNDLPKPMLKIGGKPLMELIVNQFKKAEIHTIYVTTHFQANKIIEYFGNGESFGVTIKYIEEKEPLGTAGGLRLLPRINSPLVVINGDILTNLDFRAMALFHESNEAEITIAIRDYEVGLPYGILEIKDNQIIEISEKPALKKYINAGIYIIQPQVIRHIPSGAIFDMPDLIHEVINSGGHVAGFPVIEYWMDIGYSGDYRQAEEDYQSGKLQ